MTTVAVDATGLVCADTQLTSDNYVLRVQKLFRCADGSVVTGCGDWGVAYSWIQWYVSGQSGDKPSLGRNTEVVVVNPDLSIWMAVGDSPLFPILDTTLAIGCGRDLARSALARGKTAKEAVQEACDLDAWSSEPLQTMQVMALAELPGAVTHVSKRKRTR